MKKIAILFVTIVLGSILVASCGSDTTSGPTSTLTISGAGS